MATSTQLADLPVVTFAWLRVAVDNPVKVIVIAAIVLITVYGGYGKFGHGVEFFPEVEPENEWRRRYFADGYRCQQQYRSH